MIIIRHYWTLLPPLLRSFYEFVNWTLLFRDIGFYCFLLVGTSLIPFLCLSLA